MVQFLKEVLEVCLILGNPLRPPPPECKFCSYQEPALGEGSWENDKARSTKCGPRCMYNTAPIFLSMKQPVGDLKCLYKF